MLHYAVSLGRYSIVQALIQSGVDVNECTESELTPLLIATQSGYIPIINLLIEAGADCTITDQHGQSDLKSIKHPQNINNINPHPQGICQSTTS
jgi:ankyrin repeat protein